MRTKTTLIIILLFSFVCLGQEEDKTDNTLYRLTTDQLEAITPFSYTFEKETIDSISPITKFLNDIKKAQDLYNKRHPNSTYKLLYSGKSLNLLFSKKLGVAFNTSNDLSLNRSYFNINPAEKSLSLGYNIDNRNGDPLKQLNWVFSIGAKIVSSDGFATIATGGDLEENNLGINLKFSRVYNGKIGWKTNKISEDDYLNQRQRVETNREFLFYTFNKKVEQFNKKTLPTLVEKNIQIYGEDLAKEKTGDNIEEQSKKLLYEMIEEELNYVESNGLYTSIYNSWLTLEAYFPLGDKEYSITPITSDNNATKVINYPFNTSLSWNFYNQKSKNFSYFGKFSGLIKGNSNIDVDNLKAKEFQSITTENGVSTLTKPVKAFEIDDYKRFVTTSVKGELAFFFINNRFGISPSIEKNFGEYDGVNWKLGIPLSFKDKEGKPTVNFELQWKETETMSGSQHLIGFSTSFFFGDLIKKE